MSWVKLAFLTLLAAVVVASVCCSNQPPPQTVVTLEHDACVMLDEAVSDSTAHKVCAFADELAPFVEEILTARDGAPEPRAALAFKLPLPMHADAGAKKRRRKCVAYASTDDASSDAVTPVSDGAPARDAPPQ